MMELAIEQARRSVSEPGRVSPKVGAVVVGPRGKVLGKAYRGELRPGEHAEYTLLERKLKTATLAGSILYTTLEPCTERTHPKMPCVERVIDRRFKRVVIGTLDPNGVVLGKGVMKLRKAGIEVVLFFPDLMSQLEELNREFNGIHKNLGLKTTDIVGQT
jgi:pyrimidine deaminase RibD-like protein